MALPDLIAEPVKDGEITKEQAIAYLNSMPESQRHNSDALLFANNFISRDRAVEITLEWMAGK